MRYHAKHQNDSSKNVPVTNCQNFAISIGFISITFQNPQQGYVYQGFMIRSFICYVVPMMLVLCLLLLLATNLLHFLAGHRVVFRYQGFSIYYIIYI